MTMSPGTYLRKRREAAGMTLKEVVCALACQPDVLRPIDGTDIRRLVERLTDAELDEDNLTVAQATLLRRFFPFDLGIYERLLLRFHGCGVSVPQICRKCGCTWHDACLPGPAHPELVEGCAWSDVQPDLCTACEAKAAQAATLQSGDPVHG